MPPSSTCPNHPVGRGLPPLLLERSLIPRTETRLLGGYEISRPVRTFNPALPTPLNNWGTTHILPHRTPELPTGNLSCPTLRIP